MADHMPMGQPIPDDPTDPVGGDLFPDLSDADVEDVLKGKKSLVASEDDEQPEDPPKLTPEAPEVKAEAPDAPAEVPVDEPPAPQTAEERLAALEGQLRIERLERERAEAVAERERFLHSRNAGLLGHLRKTMEERAQASDSGYTPPEDGVSNPELEEIRNEIGALKSERTQQGVAEEVLNFQRAFPDAVKNEDALTAIVQQKLPDYSDFLYGSDPKMARTMVRALLKESYAEMRIHQERERIESAVTRSYDQAEKLKARKVAAGPGASTRVTARATRPKTVDDLTDDEVESLANEYVRNAV